MGDKRRAECAYAVAVEPGGPTLTPADASARRGPHARLTIVLLGTMTAAPLLTTGVSALGPALREDLKLSGVQFGLFAVVTYSVTAVLSVPLGRFIDVTGHRTGLVLNHLLVVAALVALATSRSLAGFVVSAVLAGVALAICNPLTNRMVALFAEPRRRSSLIATKQLGVQCAQVITGTAFTAVAALLTWRAGFGLGALLVLTGLAAILLGLLPRTGPGDVRVAVPGPRPSGVRRPRRTLVVLAAYALLSGVAFQAVAFTAPLFAHDGLGLERGPAAMTGTVLGVTGLVGRLAWGALAGRVHNPSLTLVAIALVSAAALVLCAVAAESAAVWALWAGLVLYGISGAAVPVILTSAVLARFPLTETGAASGVISLGSFLGFATGPLLAAAIADHTGYAWMWAGLAGTALVAAVIAQTSRRHFHVTSMHF